MYYWTLNYDALHYAYSSTDKDCRITVESEQQFSRQSKISHFPLIFAKIRKYNNWVTNLMSGDSAELGTRQLYSLATTTTRQRNRASVIRKNTKNVKVVASKWISHNKDRQNSIINNFLAWKHGHVVAAVHVVACPALYVCLILLTTRQQKMNFSEYCLYRCLRRGIRSWFTAIIWRQLAGVLFQALYSSNRGHQCIIQYMLYTTQYILHTNILFS